MANQNAAHGFAPIGTMDGAAYRVQEFVKLAAFGHAIYVNDVVHRTGGASGTNSEGRVVGVIEGSDTASTGVTQPTGVLMNYAPASKLTDHQVIVNPNLVMEAQDNGGANPGGGAAGTHAGDPGKNANIDYTGAGTVHGTASGAQGISGQQIDAVSIATTNTLDLHLWELLQETEALGGNAFGANARIVVSFNSHRYANQVAGV